MMQAEWAITILKSRIMISWLELIAAGMCFVIVAYVLLDGIVPIYLLMFATAGIVAGLLVLPRWFDR
ncbi:MAG TPA: hypothetical protein VKY59_05940 [Spirillospora sp.]|nr:hypothetical protein [Spirillospora sp.]